MSESKITLELKKTANKEVAFQNEEKKKRADELIIANKKLAFQNEEKEKCAAELIIANERYRETNEYLENLLNYTNAPTIVWNSQYNITRFNKAFESITGRNEKDMIGKSVKILFPTVNSENTMELIKKAIDGERLVVIEIDILHLDGSVRTLQWNSSNIMSRDGKTIIATIAQGHDITKRKLAEKELRESERKLKEVQELAHLGFWNWDIKTGDVEWSEEVFKIFCLDPKEFVPHIDSILSLSPWPEDNQRDKELINRAIETHRPGSYEQKFLRPDKSIGYYYSTFQGKYNEDGDLISIIGTVLDITERKQAEEAIQILNIELEQRVIERTAQLEAANKELETFSYSVSHDLRAPLRSVHAYTNILLEEYQDKLDKEGKRLCGIISSGASQMGELIDDLLSFSRIGRSTMNVSIIDMRTMAESVFRQINGERKAAKTDIKIGNLHKVFGDTNLIKLVWNNLISNALKYSSKEIISEILISSQQEGDMIIYSVKDNGVGFDMQYKHKLFGVFQRLHNESEFEGNGVGLATVQRIILRHNGSVWAEGEVGKGATFYFSLPVQDKRQK